MKLLHIYTDGGARGNPGPAGIGVVIQDEKGKVVEEFGEYIGETTNNVAEYTALLRALTHAEKYGIPEVMCFADSELLVRQLNREYRVKNEDLAALFLKVWNILSRFSHWSIQHIPRSKNKHADRLVNEAIDARCP